jgi:hypothetical protein
MQLSVRIGSDFFTKGLRDYANWRWAWVRELVQNGVDAGSRNISFDIAEMDDEICVATCVNDGPPMDRETLLNKFLSLGGSTKNNGQSIGGFGLAKVVIALAHVDYSIHTGSTLVKGSGGEFELLDAEHFSGVKTTVTIRSSASRMDSEIRRFLSYMQGKNGIRIVHNGKPAALDLCKNKARRALSFGTVHVNKAHSSLVVVRVNGVPMYYDEDVTDKCVILELTQSSLETLTANRDGLQYKYQGEFNKFIQQLAVNKKSALREDTIAVTHFEGSKIHVEKKREQEESSPGSPEPDDSESGFLDGLFDDVNDVAAKTVIVPSGQGTQVPARAPAKQFAVVEDFFVRNELGIKVPAHYLPYRSTFSAYSKRLVKKWSLYLMRLHQLFNKDGHFAVGFVFSEEVEALYERSPERGTVYYINPAKVVKQASSNSRSLQKRYNAKDDYKLLMIAAHEFLHGCGYSWHDEEFASKLTDVAGAIAGNLRFFRPKAKGPVDKEVVPF